MGRWCKDLAERAWPDNVQEVQDALSSALGIPVLFALPSGIPLAACEELDQFCRHFTRAVPVCRPCLECRRPDVAGGGSDVLAASTCMRHFTNPCPLGAADVSAPVVCAGDVVGYLVTAQVRTQPEDGAGWAAEHGWGRGEDQAEFVLRLQRRSARELAAAGQALWATASLVSALVASRSRSLRLAERVREQARAIRSSTRTDAVTGLLNRGHFGAAVQAELRRARRYARNVSVAVADVDGFRQINDTFGHEVGDAVLRAVAECLTSTLRETDTAARVGGDEFGLLLPETVRHEALIPLARVRSMVDDLNASGELPVEVNLWFGLVDQTVQGDDLLAEALRSALKARETGAVLR